MPIHTNGMVFPYLTRLRKRGQKGDAQSSWNLGPLSRPGLEREKARSRFLISERPSFVASPVDAIADSILDLLAKLLSTHCLIRMVSTLDPIYAIGISPVANI